MKIAYVGIDLLESALHAVLDAGCEVMRLFTCRTDNVTEFNTGVLETARKRGIPVTLERITPEDLEQLSREGCELLLCAGYYYRIPVTDAFPMVNIHPAPLPDCRGAWPMPLILLGAYPRGGATLHRMARDFDTGDILMGRTFPIHPGDTLEDYMRQVNALVPELVSDLLSHLPERLKGATAQGEGRYLPNPDESVYTVTDGMTAEEADRILRAFYGYECMYCREGRRFELIGGRAVRGTPQGQFPLRDGFIQAPRAKECSLAAR